MTYREDSCLLWPYGKQSDGYGLIKISGQDHVASRIVCERAHGKPPAGRLDAAHSCSTPACINPRHLRWATRSENMMDRVGAGTSNRGERHGKVKLTEQQVREIRELFHLSDRIIGERYGVSLQTIRSIRTGRNWAWLGD